MKINDATIKLTGSEIIQPNETNKLDNPILAIKYDFTNTSDKNQKPSIVWIACFDATQETNATVDDLDVGLFYDKDKKYETLKDMGDTDVKPDATVQSIFFYEIKHTDSSVTLTASQGMAGKELGTKKYEIK